jgi:hypothetical protein
VIRRFYEGLPAESQSAISYYDFLKVRGRHGILKGLVETLIAFLMLMILVQYFGLTPLTLSLGGL